MIVIVTKVILTEGVAHTSLDRHVETAGVVISLLVLCKNGGCPY